MRKEEDREEVKRDLERRVKKEGEVRENRKDVKSRAEGRSEKK